MAIIQQSREQLAFSNSVSAAFTSTPLTFTQSYVKQLQQSFHPPLPDDVLVEFTIDEYKLIINVYGITFSTTIPSKNVINMDQPILMYVHFIYGVTKTIVMTNTNNLY